MSAEPHLIIDLVRFLRQLGYTVEEVEYGVVDAGELTLAAALQLRQRLQVWNAVNGADARLLEV